MVRETSQKHTLWVFRGDADAMGAEGRAAGFKSDDQEIFQKAAMAFDLSHAG